MVLKRENEALRRRSETLEELVKHMVCMPEDIAQVILWRLRTTSNPLLVLQSIRGETLSDQLSEQATARGILPLVQSGLEFELMVRHPVSYPTLDPLKDNSLLKSPLLIPANLLVMSLSPDLENPQGNFLTQQIFDSCDASSGSEEHITQFEPIRHESTDGDLPENVAQQAHCYFNPQLNGLSIAFWTAVPVTNQYAASVISLYLETDHPLLGLFDSQLFVGNLVDCRLEFCSPFLVSALLSFASVSSMMLLRKLRSKYPVSKRMLPKIQRLRPEATNSKVRLRSFGLMRECPTLRQQLSVCSFYSYLSSATGRVRWQQST